MQNSVSFLMQKELVQYVYSVKSYMNKNQMIVYTRY